MYVLVLSPSHTIAALTTGPVGVNVLPQLSTTVGGVGAILDRKGHAYGMSVERGGRQSRQ